MSRVADIVGRVIESCQKPDGRFLTHEAVAAAFPIAKADEECADILIKEGLGARIGKAARRARNGLKGSDREQATLWGKMHVRYALDLDGRMLKERDELTQIEFARVRQIRRESIASDTAHLKVLDEAAKALAPLWGINPELTFGQVATLYVASQQAAE